MVAVGIDIGSTSGEVLILDGDDVLAWSIVDTGYNSRQAAAQALQEALAGTAGEAVAALRRGDVAEFRRGRAFLQSKIGHLR